MTTDEALDKALEALAMICVKCRSNEWGPDTPRKEILNWFHDFASKALDDTTPPAAKPAPVQEPVAWKNAAIRLGEELSSVGPDGYYDMTAEQWLDWAMDQRPRGKNSLPAAQRQWVGLTDEEVMQTMRGDWTSQFYFARAIEAKLKEKNT